MTPPRIAFSTAFTFDLQRFATTLNAANFSNAGIDSSPIKYDDGQTDDHFMHYELEAGDYELNENITLEAPIIINSDVTLDLKGKTLTLNRHESNNEAAIYVESGKSFTVKDTSENPSGKIVSGTEVYKTIGCSTNVTLNIENVTLHNKYTSYGHEVISGPTSPLTINITNSTLMSDVGKGINAAGNISISDSTIETYRECLESSGAAGANTVEITNSTIKSTATGDNAKTAISYSGNDANAKIIINSGEISGGWTGIENGVATLEIKGGTITGGKYGVNNNSTGTINISGTASITGNGTDYNHAGVINSSTGTIIISGGSITGTTGVLNYDTGNVLISDGNIVGTNYAVQNWDNTPITITGGTFSNYLRSRFEYVTKNNGYTISGGNFDTFDYTSASKVLAYTGLDSNSNAGLIGVEGWNKTSTANTWIRVSETDAAKGRGGIDFTLSNVKSVEDANVDSTNKVVGVLASNVVDNANPTADNDYKTAAITYNNDKTAATVATFADATSITSAVLGNTVATITGHENSYTLYIGGSDTLKAITGGDKDDTLVAGDKGATLDGGAGADSLVGGAGNDYFIGGDGADTFIYTASADSIEGYVMGTDLVSLGSGLTAPTSFDSIESDGSNFTLLFSDTNKLTFTKTASVSLKGDEGTYVYTPNSIALEGVGISLGAGYTSKTYDGRDFDYTTIDAKAVTVSGGLTIRGNDTASSLIGAKSGGAIYGGYRGDTLKATDGGTLLDGSDDNDLLIGGGGADTFFYSAGADSIQSYDTGDLVSVKGLNPAEATFSVSGNNIKLDFGGSDNLTFNAFASGVSLQSGKNTYVYTKDYYTFNDKGITLAAGHSAAYNGSNTAYETIDASAVSVTGGIFVTGNSLDNVIFGSTVNGGSLYGGAGNDKLDVTERSKDAKYVFQYTAGKDTIENFAGGADSLAIDLTKLTIESAKTGNDRLTFNFSDSKNALVLKGDALEKISLSGGTNYLTKDGVVSGTSLKLFASAKGLIDLKEDTIYSGAGITSVDAAAASKPITLVGGENGGSFTFAANNKKRDVFEYGGGSVTISGYESGTDKINLGDASITGFAVTQGGGVLLSVVDGSKTSAISIAGAQGQEVLIHDASSKSNSYAKMVFKATGVLENKEKRPTEATVLAGASGYEASNTIKKVFVMGGVSGVSIGAGNNKTTLDASAASGVSLYGGSKNDKFIGSGGADMFVYSGGKDEIQNFGENDSISLGGDFANNFENAKITASKRSYKFKFGGKNTLAIKGESLSGAFNINGETKTFAKNAIGDVKGNVSLTSSFSGTYKIDDDDNVNNVDGSQVKKNLTFKGTEEAETFTGGTKKTKFKGGGGKDTLIGGDGKDTFFYAKGESGEVTIEKFDFSKDKLKIASNTISEISTVSGGVKFDMSDGSFNVISSSGGGNIDTTKTLIKANSTYYWFADSSTADETKGIAVGDLITADTKVKKGDASGFEVIDLGYSTNLVKTNVAVKVANAKPNQTT